MPKHLGNIHVIRSKGPHDRSAALGMALQSIGHGYKVFVLHFLNNAAHRGEFKLQESVGPLEVAHFATEGETHFHDPNPEELHFAGEALDYARKVLARTDRPDVMILDDINPVIHYGLLNAQEVLDFLDNKPQHVEMILTGDPVHRDIADKAHIVTEVTSLKGGDIGGPGITF